MAIYSFQCNIVARGQRLNNAVAHSAYINRIDDKNEKDGTSWRYAHKSDDIAFSDVLLPIGASNYFKKYNHKSRIDRRTLNDQLLEATEDFEKNPTAENYKRVVLLDRPAFKRVSQKSLKEEQSKRIKIKKQIEIKSEKEYKRFKDILNAHESITIEKRNPDPVVRRPRQKKQNNEIIPLVPFFAVNTENTSEPKKTKEYVYKIPLKERLRSRLIYLANKRKVQKQNKEIENKIKKGQFWNAAVFTDSQKMANTDHLASKEYKSYKDTLKDNFANRLFEKGKFSGSRKDYDVSLIKDHKLVVRPRVKGDYSIK